MVLALIPASNHQADVKGGRVMLLSGIYAVGKLASKNLTTALYRLSLWNGRILACAGVLLLFMPKINIVNLQSNAAGLRIDDLFLLTCFGFFGACILYYPVLRVRKIELAFTGWVIATAASNILNMALYGRSSILYSLRFIEYFLFFYFGYYFAQRYSLRKVARATLWVNGIVMVLQELHVIGGFASAGYVSGVDRPIGLTGGPWEVGGLINFCLIILIFGRGKRAKSA